MEENNKNSKPTKNEKEPKRDIAGIFRGVPKSRAPELKEKLESLAEQYTKKPAQIIDKPTTNRKKFTFHSIPTITYCRRSQ